MFEEAASPRVVYTGRGAASPKSAVKMPTPILRRWASFPWYQRTASGLLRSKTASSTGGLPDALRTT